MSRRQANPKSHEAIQDGRALIGANLRKRRHALGLSQEKVATLAGLHWTYVSSVERAQRNISIDNICKLAAALGIHPRDLLVPDKRS